MSSTGRRDSMPEETKGQAEEADGAGKNILRDSHLMQPIHDWLLTWPAVWMGCMITGQTDTWDSVTTETAW